MCPFYDDLYDVIHNKLMDKASRYCIWTFLLQVTVRFPFAGENVNVSVTIGNGTCSNLITTWKEDWKTEYGIHGNVNAKRY